MHRYKVLKNSQGFSVTELLIIVGMLGIMASLSIPMLTSSMKDLQLLSDARSIASSLSYAKLSAASQMTRYRFSADLDSNQWSIEKRNPSSGTFEIQGPSNALGNGVADSHIEFKATSSPAPTGFPTTSATTVTFNSRGIPTEGARAIYLSNLDANYAVTVSLSGKVQLMRYKNSAWTNQ